jgi:hypothetical protein
MTAVEVGEVLASIATSSTTRPLLEMWRDQRPTFQLPHPLAITTTAQADPPFWKTVAVAWADDFLFRAYVQQEKKQALLASLPATLHTPTLPSSSRVVTMKTMTSSVGDVKTPLPTATAVPPCSPHASMSMKKMTKKPQFPLLKPRTKKIGWWRYVSAEEWAERQMTEEEFRCIAEGCTHLGPRSARHAVPYPPLPTALYATRDLIMSSSIFPPLTDEASPQPSGSKSLWE